MSRARFMMANIMNFHINTLLRHFEYVRLKITDIRKEIIVDHDDLKSKVTTDGYLFLQVRKGVYGLPQAGFLAQKLL